jgi:hypothetical protein
MSKMKTAFRWAGLTSLVVGGVATVSAAVFIAIVTPSSLTATGWTALVANDATMQFVDGPPNAAGGGSVELRIPKNDDAGAELRLTDREWAMPLERLASLTYNTYVASDKHCDRAAKNSLRAPLAALNLDTNGDAIADQVLLFDPAVNGAIACNQWQQWNTTDADSLWYWANDPKSQKSPAPLASYRAAYPNATIVFGGVRLLAGFDSRWKDFLGYIDAFSIGRTDPCEPPVCLPGPLGIYDFEPNS